jgi:ribulose-phosphate 3-epimerase
MICDDIKMIIIEPSILSADPAFLGEQVLEVEAAGATVIQIDVMDGRFVPNLAFGPNTVKALRPLVKMKLDVHLMIIEPEGFIQQFVDAGADRLIVHQETCPHLARTLRSIQKAGVEAGVTLKPDTDAAALEEVLELADLIQVMTVNPGFGGQMFLASQLPKIRQLRDMLDERGLSTPISVDGGINLNSAPLAVEAGATILIAGSSIFNHEASITGNFQALTNSIQKP